VSIYRFTVTIRVTIWFKMVSRVSRVSTVSSVGVRVSVRVMVRFSFSNRVGIGFPDVRCVAFYLGNPTSSHSQ